MVMHIRFVQSLIFVIASLLINNTYAAADSYRFLHVTIETPWAIFIFLLLFIMIPFILMAMLYWYFAFKKNKESAPTDVAEQQSAVDKPTE